MKSLKIYLLATACLLATVCSPAWATGLTFGTTVSGTITLPAQTFSYIIAANAGDVIDITMTTTSGSIQPAILLYSPNGTLLTSAYNYYNSACQSGPNTTDTTPFIEMNAVTLAVAGNYTIVAQDCSSTFTGSYNLYAQRTNNPGGATGLTFGATQANSIGMAAQSNTYTFTATANDEIDLSMTATSGSLSPKIRLYDPTGTLVTTAANYYNNNCQVGVNSTDTTPTVAMDPVTATLTGTYTVLIGDCNDTLTGNYELFAQRTNNPGDGSSLPFGQITSGSITVAAQNNTYTFNANANDSVTLDMVATSGSLSPVIRLYSPTGTLLTTGYNYYNNNCQAGLNAIDTTPTVDITPVVLTAAGKYTVLVGDCNSTNTGAYELYIQRTNNPGAAASLSIGGTLASTIGSVAQNNTYTFHGTVNDVMDFSMETTSGTLLPKIRLYDPNGVLLATQTNFYNSNCQAGINPTDTAPTAELNTVTLATTGTYTVLLGDCNDINTGNYTFYSQRITSPVGASDLLYGQLQPGQISMPAQENSYTFYGSANDSVSLTMSSTGTSNPLEPRIRLYTPSGVLLTYAANYTSNNCQVGTTVKTSSVTLPASGTYTVLVGDCNDVYSGTYNLSSLCFGTCGLPAPSLASLSQTSATAGSTGFTLTVNGSDYFNNYASTVVEWNGTPLATTWLSTTQMTAVVPAGDLASAGTFSVTAFTPTPGGGTSAPIQFNVNNPVPTTSSPLSPASVTGLGSNFTLTVTGTNFVQSSIVQWNGNALATTYVSSTSLQATVPASDITNGGTASVTVYNPSPGGGTSGAQTFTINNPVPSPTSLSPSSAEVGGAGFTLTVNGTNFVQASTVNWNGSGLASTFVSATELQATVPSSDITTVGSAIITVSNPTPGGGTSTTSVSIPIESALPSLTSPAPSTMLPGPTATFTWSAAYSASYYELYVGSTGIGANNLYSSGPQTGNSLTVSNLPTNGETIYVRLLTNFSGVWKYADYTYTAVTKAALTTPAPGSTLGSPNVTFSWTPATGTEVSGYRLYLGSTGVGSNNLYSSTLLTGTSFSALALPTNGETIYARLITSFNGTLSYSDYTYRADTKAEITSPAPGGLLPGRTVTFAWSSAVGATGYELWLGSTGVGSSNLYNSLNQKTTSITVASLPSNGEKIYARMLTDFNGSWTSIDYTFTSVTQSAMTSPTPGSTLAGPSITFSWSAGVGATAYQLYLGSSGAGSNNLYNSGTLTATSFTAANLPTNGATIYARLLTNFNGSFAYTDYTYTADTHAVMTSPAPGGLLPGPNATFAWTTATGATAYQLYLGSTGAGSDNLYNSGSQSGTSFTATNLPTNGETIYARVLTSFAGTWSYADYTYTAATHALLASPTPGSTLTSTTVTFTLTPATGTEATAYELYLGSTGAGSSNLYSSGQTTNTSLTVKGLPNTGGTINVRVLTNFNGVWGYVDYTLTAQ
jgi:hypothetical protein